jgi:VWFA-related protein
MNRFTTAAALLLASLPLFAQQTKPAYGEKVDVNVVLVDATVTDAKGNQILGLGKDDFTVTENGQPQAIESVDYFTNRKLLTDREQNAAFKVERVREERYFVFFFDKPEQGQLFDRIRQARDAAANFVDHEMRAEDRVAIVAHDVRLKVFSDFSADKAQLHKALDEVLTFGLGRKKSDAAVDASPSILAAINGKKMMSGSGTVYEALNVLADALRPIKARKDLVLFSAGIVEPGEEVRDGLVLTRSRYYDPMIHALNASNVSVYSVNLQHTGGDLPFIHQTLQSIAVDTNGEYYRNNISFTGPVHRVEEANSGYYLLSYHTQKPAGTKGYQKVNVVLKNRDFRLKAREGYVYGD